MIRAGRLSGRRSLSATRSPRQEESDRQTWLKSFGHFLNLFSELSRENPRHIGDIFGVLSPRILCRPVQRDSVNTPLQDFVINILIQKYAFRCSPVHSCQNQT
jgi:hypothetical protein